MIKIKLYDNKKTYMYPNGVVATPEKIIKDFPAANVFPHIIETDEYEQVLFSIQNFAAVKSQMGIDPNLSDEEVISKIEELRNKPAPEPEPDSLERVAAALEYQNLMSM